MINMSRKKIENGFTLIEMAIVIAIMGLILSGGFSALTPLMKRNKLSKSVENINTIEQALTAYIIQNGYLPCPASNVNQPEGNCNGYASVQALHGIVPWRALGLTKNQATDGWGRMISLSVDTNYVQGAAKSLDCTSSGNPETQWSSLTGRIVILENDGVAASDDKAKAAYAIISHGENGHRAIMPSGVIFAGSITPSPTNEEIGNSVMGSFSTPTNPPPTYYTSALSSNNQVGFDDIIKFKNPGRIMVDIGCVNPDG